MPLSRLKVTITDEWTSVFLEPGARPIEVAYNPDGESFLYVMPPVAGNPVPPDSFANVERWVIRNILPGGLAPETYPAYTDCPNDTVVLNAKGLWTDGERAVYMTRVGFESIAWDANGHPVPQFPVNASYPDPAE